MVREQRRRARRARRWARREHAGAELRGRGRQRARGAEGPAEARKTVRTRMTPTLSPQAPRTRPDIGPPEGSAALRSVPQLRLRLLGGFRVERVGVAPHVLAWHRRTD